MSIDNRTHPPTWTLSIFAGAVCVALILILGLMQWREAQAATALRAVVEHSNSRQRLVTAYLALLQDSETGQRGYLVTGVREFRQPFDRAMSRLPSSEQAIEDAYPNGDPARAEAMQLLTVGRNRADHAAQNVRLWESGDRAAALTGVRGGAGKTLMDRARQLASDLVAREDKISRRAWLEGSSSAAARQRTVHLTQVALLLALLVLVSGLFRTVRSLKSSAALLRDSATRQAAIFENATDAMMMLDAKGTIEAVNAAAERLFGRDRNALIGASNLVLFADPPSPEISQAYLQRLADGVTSQGRQEFIGTRGDGTQVVAEVVTTPIRLEDGLHFLAIARDATERHRTERLKNEFVATVSHELRTPLTSIAGSLGLLAGGAAGELPPKAGRLVEIAHGNSERLIRLINDILDMEKIEAGKMSFHLVPLPVCALLEQAVEANQLYAARHQIILEFDSCPADWEVIADQDRFMQVMANLLSNAVKFSPAGAKVRLSAERFADRIRVNVIDRGPGIDEQFQSRIFGKFAQADSTDTRQKGGTGLGLSIARHLVQHMGGQISFESELGEGTTFSVDLPSPPATAPIDEWAEPIGRLSDQDLPQLLHVDDDSDTLRLVGSAFEGIAEVRSTPSVAEARASLQRYEFDAVIIDIGMSDGCGLELVPLIRRAPRRIPIILFTALDAEHGGEKDTDAHLTKSKSGLHELVSTTSRLISEAAT